MAFTVKKALTAEDLERIVSRFHGADPTAIDLTVRLMICANHLEEMVQLHFGQWDLSPARFSCLMKLWRSPHRSAKPIELAEQLGVTRGNMTGLIENLERDGYVEREHDEEDRRVNAVHMTEKGNKHLQRMLPSHFERITKMVEPLTEQERKVFLTCLEKLTSTISNLKDDFQIEHPK